MPSDFGPITLFSCNFDPIYLQSYPIVLSFDHNERALWAFRYLRETHQNLFLTGKAGTGKTTFLAQLRTSLPKRIVVLAPTGVAAVRAGGVTIHSFFQLPFTPYLPGSTYVSAMEGSEKRYARKFSAEKIRLFRSIDLLVIDEVSMVRADLLDAVDNVLRKFRNRQLPFGGVQLLLVGDLQQLPPVVQDAEWDLLRNVYNSPFFYDSISLQEAGFVTIELETIYRQSEGRFIGALNQIREQRATPETLNLLNSRLEPGFSSDQYITLTTHNAQAQHINDTKLEALGGTLRSYQAVVEGDFPPFSFPTEALLALKEGARVMFLRNDISPVKRFFNGKIGTVIRFAEQSIEVLPDGDTEPVRVEPEAWHNTRYHLEPSTGMITETVIGSFKQFPLRLAWAITIHKSQGLTFEKVIVDAGRAFAHGQVYVALSRCRSLEGLVLRTPITREVVLGDKGVTAFLRQNGQRDPDPQAFAEARRAYVRRLVYEMLDFTPIASLARNLMWQLREHHQILFGPLTAHLPRLAQQFDEEVVRVFERFTPELERLFHGQADPESYPTLQDRVTRSARYFADRIHAIWGDQSLLRFETDNKAVKKSCKELIGRLDEALLLKNALLSASTQHFSAANYLDTRAKVLAAPDARKAKSAEGGKRSGKGDPDVDALTDEAAGLAEALKRLRRELAAEKGIPAYRIFPQKCLADLIEKQPVTLRELENVHGMGKVRAQQFGTQILEVILSYRGLL
ncbi:MAG: HRDC domain-containing protein [Bacteroidales bacterium]